MPERRGNSKQACCLKCQRLCGVSRAPALGLRPRQAGSRCEVPPAGRAAICRVPLQLHGIRCLETL